MKVLSHTAIQDFLTCPRKFEWRRIRKLRKARRGDALRLGERYHQGLDLLKKGIPVQSVIAQIWAAYEDVPASIRNLEAWWLEREICIRLLGGWDAFTEKLNVLASEYRYEGRIRNPITGRATNRFRILGVLDGIVRLQDGRLALLEHKTTGQAIELHSDFIRRLRIDSQISRYLLGIQENGLDVSTVIYDITRKPSIKPRRLTKKQIARLQADGTYLDQPLLQVPEAPERETAEMFGIRLAEDICRHPERYYRRLEIPRLERDLETEARELWQQQQAIAGAFKTGDFFRNTNACLSPYRCEFADLCLAGITPADLEAGEVPDGYQRSTPKEVS